LWIRADTGALKKRGKVNRDLLDKIFEITIRWCIYAVVFAVPFSKSISEICISVAIVFWAARKIMNKDYRLAATDINIPLLVFMLAIIPSFFNSAYLAMSIKAYFTKMLKYAVLYFVIVETVDTRSKMKNLFIISFISMALILIDGIFQYFTGFDLLHFPSYPAFKCRSSADSEGFFRGFPTACFPFPNDLGSWILLTLFPLGSAVIFDLKKNKAKYLAALVSVGLLGLLFLTKARGAWVAFAVSIVYIALSKKKVWLIMLLILLLALPFILKMEMAKYIFGFASIGDRFSMWDTGWQIFRNHPVIGNGLNTFFENFKQLRNDQWKGQKGSYAHNCYLQMAGDIGIIGLGSFLWLIFSYFYSVYKRLEKVDDRLFNPALWGMSIGVFAFLVHGFFDTNLYSLNLATLFWCAIAISQAVIRVSKT
jgi:O-antigen ligase